MSWAMHHSQSEVLAAQAEIELRKGNTAEARALYLQAAQAELRAINDLDQSKVRTLSISVVSAASLFFKAHQFRQAQLVAYKWLSEDSILPFASDQLTEIVQKTLSEQSLQQSKFKFTPGEVLVSVSGGEVIYGGAPLDLIHRKVDEVRNIFYRTVELLLELPLRKTGAPRSDIQEQCRPWLFHAPPGSYQFAVRVQRPNQLQLPEFEDLLPRVDEVTQKFLEIISAAASDPQGEMEQVVPNEEYRETFLKMARNLAPPPTGGSFNQIEIRPAFSLETTPVKFSASSREFLTKAIAVQPGRAALAPIRTEQVTGILRGLHLDKHWIEVVVDGKSQRINEVREVVDDVIGPMVNHRVTVDVVRKNSRFLFQDIQSED